MPNHVGREWTALVELSQFICNGGGTVVELAAPIPKRPRHTSWFLVGPWKTYQWLALRGAFVMPLHVREIVAAINVTTTVVGLTRNAAINVHKLHCKIVL
jgi:hypothetical protein